MNSFFLINSSDFEYCNDSVSEKIKNTLLSFLIGFFVIIVLILVIANPLDLLLTKFMHFESVNESLSKSHKIIIANPFYMLVFIIPFVEELLFRLILKVNKFNISVFGGLVLYIILGGKISKFDIYNFLDIVFILISIAASIVSYFYFPSKIIDYLNKRKSWLITTSIILFGLMHIFNIKDLHWLLIPFYPFFVFPQLIMGYFITNLRLKYGFLWGFLLHALFNTLNFFISSS
jgi:hypothetical protein